MQGLTMEQHPGGEGNTIHILITALALILMSLLFLWCNLSDANL